MSDSGHEPTQPETIDAQTVEETVRKYDQESTFRTQLGWWKWVVFALGTALTAFQLYTALKGNYVSLIQGAIHVAGGMSLVFLLYPAKKAWSGRPGVPFYDVILCAAALWTNFHIVSDYKRLTTQTLIHGFSDYDFIIAVLGILLILEATRRCVGLPIVVIAALALAYGYFGAHIPIFGHAGFSLRQLATESYYTSRSIFGTPIQVSSTFIYLFLFFGVVLVKTNIGGFFNDVAFALTGRFTGGTAKAAVVASGLQGMVSGSSVANTVASGSFTIPLMKKAGFRPHFAAATEATASTGGQIMPPIMGAAAFIMAQNVPGLEYNGLIVIAIIPALLYFLGAFLSIHFEAKMSGILGMAKSALPDGRELLKRIDLLLPLAVIVLTLLTGMSPIRAALFGIGTAFVLSFLRKMTRLGPRALVNVLVAGARTALPVIAACATAGIVAGTVTVTGLGGQLGKGLVDLAGGNFFIVLFMVMIACLVLGMGLPTTANYVVTATVAAPILYNNFDVPLIAAHMFVFYFGILADITPPVCLAAYAGAGIAGANPMKAGVTAVRIAIAGFLIPYVFIIQPALLLQGTWQDMLSALVTLCLGMVGVAAGMAGYFFGVTNVVERVLLVAGGIALVYPALWISLIGLVVLIAVAILQKLRKAETSDQIAHRNGQATPAA